MSESEASIEKQIAAAIAELQERVEPARQFQIPETNYQAFGTRAADIERYCQNLIEWLGLPYRYDKFGDNHKSRREWFEQFEKKFGETVKTNVAQMGKNKFRGNLAAVITMSQMIGMWLAEVPHTESLTKKIAEINRLQDTVARGLHQADNQESEDRKTHLMYLEDLVVQFLRELAAWSH